MQIGHGFDDHRPQALGEILVTSQFGLLVDGQRGKSRLVAVGEAGKSGKREGGFTESSGRNHQQRGKVSEQECNPKLQGESSTKKYYCTRSTYF